MGMDDETQRNVPPTNPLQKRFITLGLNLDLYILYKETKWKLIGADSNKLAIAWFLDLIWVWLFGLQ